MSGRPKLQYPKSTCHPEKVSYTSKGGLCILCYKREWARAKRRKNPPEPRSIIVRMATCHPEKRHWGKGLCLACYAKVYRKTYPDKNKIASAKWRKNNKAIQWRRHLRYRYGLTEEDYASLLKSQNNCCKLCQVNPIRTPVIDHCHATDKVRGIVCQRCNMAIGLFEGYKDVLHKIPDYLEG